MNQNSSSKWEGNQGKSTNSFKERERKGKATVVFKNQVLQVKKILKRQGRNDSQKLRRSNRRGNRTRRNKPIEQDLETKWVIRPQEKESKGKADKEGKVRKVSAAY